MLLTAACSHGPAARLAAASDTTSATTPVPSAITTTAAVATSTAVTVQVPAPTISPATTKNPVTASPLDIPVGGTVTVQVYAPGTVPPTTELYNFRTPISPIKLTVAGPSLWTGTVVASQEGDLVVAADIGNLGDEQTDVYAYDHKDAALSDSAPTAMLIQRGGQTGLDVSLDIDVTKADQYDASADLADSTGVLHGHGTWTVTTGLTAGPSTVQLFFPVQHNPEYTASGLTVHLVNVQLSLRAGLELEDVLPASAQSFTAP